MLLFYVLIKEVIENRKNKEREREYNLKRNIKNKEKYEKYKKQQEEFKQEEEELKQQEEELKHQKLCLWLKKYQMKKEKETFS
jgi:hypothetical protein